jgi:two-component sensor histidine kinase
MGKKAGRRLGRLEAERDVPFNAAILHAHGEIVKRRYLLLAASIAAYGAIMLAFGDALEDSINYFVFMPLIMAALGFGSPGGIVSGALGLPANLFFFYVLGHPEFSPSNKLIAELFGVAVGLSLGLLADYFGEIRREMRRREDTEASLRDTLAEKELLLRELHHRVKNNLNVMKSLVQLQQSRSSDPSFIKAADDLVGRIFAMALVHDQLYGDPSEGPRDLGAYVSLLARNLASSLGFDPARVRLADASKGRRLSAEAAMPLGLIMNEVITNAAKYARTEANPDPSVFVSLEARGPEYRLAIEDNGPGPAARAESGLGMKLVTSLAAHIGGSAALSAIEGPHGPSGTRFELRWSEAERG